LLDRDPDDRTRGGATPPSRASARFCMFSRSQSGRDAFNEEDR
jgi:hypothetical protein